MMKRSGLTLSQFEAMYRRWEVANGFPAGALPQKALAAVLNYLQQVSPFAIEEQRGKTILHLSVYKSSSPTDKLAVVLGNDGEIWGVDRYITNRQRRRNLELQSQGYPYGVPQEFKKPIESPKTTYKDLFKEESWESVIFLGARLLRSKLIETGLVLHENPRRKSLASEYDHDKLHASLLAFMRKFEKRRRAAAANAFLGKLDPEIYALTQTLSQGSSAIYNWLNAKGDKHAQAWRQQVAKQSPLVVLLASGLGAKLGYDREPAIGAASMLTLTIDDGDSLPDALLGALFYKSYPKQPFAKAGTRFFLSLNFGDIPNEIIPEFCGVFRYLDGLNPNWYPKNHQEWIDYHACVTNFEYFRTVSPHHPVEKLLQETGGKWAEYAKLIEDHGKLADLGDWFGMIRQKIVSAKLRAEGNPIPAGNLSVFSAADYYQGLHVRDIIEASARWHRDNRQFSAKICSVSINKDDQPRPLSWLPLSPPMTAPNGILCKPLTTPAELKIQHEHQAHCVDGYSSSCLYGTSHIISLEKGEILTTVELREAWDKASGKITGVTIAQHQGYQRRRPYPEEVEAINWYVQSIKPDWNAVAETKLVAKRDQEKNAIILAYGFDPYDEATRRRVFEICRPYFPTASQRNMSYDEWFERVARLDALIERERTGQMRTSLPLWNLPDAAPAQRARFG